MDCRNGQGAEERVLGLPCGYCKVSHRTVAPGSPRRGGGGLLNLKPSGRGSVLRGLNLFENWVESI